MLCLVGVGFAIVTVARAARHKADAAADFAALAAAVVLMAGSADPCGQAAVTANANGAELQSCAVNGESVSVAVTVRVALARWGIGTAQARARAGPADLVPP